MYKVRIFYAIKVYEIYNFIPIKVRDFGIIVYMDRTILKDLLAWKLSAGRKPLILQGARQTGKTYAIKKFAELHYKNHFSFIP